VTTTPSTLDTLLDAAVTGRTLGGATRQVNLQNTGAATIYILENDSQTVAEGVQLKASGERFYETSPTAWGENAALDTDSISGSYFAVAAGTVTMVVEELA